MHCLDGIDASQLVQEVLRVTKEVCSKWKAQLPPAVTRAQKLHVPLVSEHAIKNTRRKMEDRHVIMPYLSELSGLQVCSCECVHRCVLSLWEVG